MRKELLTKVASSLMVTLYQVSSLFIDLFGLYNSSGKNGHKFEQWFSFAKHSTGEKIIDGSETKRYWENVFMPFFWSSVYPLKRSVKTVNVMYFLFIIYFFYFKKKKWKERIYFWSICFEKGLRSCPGSPSPTPPWLFPNSNGADVKNKYRVIFVSFQSERREACLITRMVLAG